MENSSFSIQSISVKNYIPIVNSAGNLVAGDRPIWTPDPEVTIADHGYSLYPALFQGIQGPENAVLSVSITTPDVKGKYFLAGQYLEAGNSLGQNLLYSKSFDVTDGSKNPDGSQAIDVYLQTKYLPVQSPFLWQINSANITWNLLPVTPGSGDGYGPIPTQLELYCIFGKPGAMWDQGVWVTILRDLCNPWAGNPSLADAPGAKAAAIKSIVDMCFSGPTSAMAGAWAKSYAIKTETSYYLPNSPQGESYFGLKEYFQNQPVDRRDPVGLGGGQLANAVDCTDMSAFLQICLCAVGIVNDRVAGAFGYFNSNLIGFGPCNNPSFGSNGLDKLLQEGDSGRSYWDGHSFVLVDGNITLNAAGYITAITGGTIADACGGPHYATESPEAYYAAAVDTSPEAMPLYDGKNGRPTAPGNAKSLLGNPLVNVTSINAVNPSAASAVAPVGRQL